MRVTRPISVVVSPGGVAFAESVHDRDFQMAERRDPFHKLLYVVHGQTRLWLDRGHGAYVISAGAVALVSGGVAHRMTDERPATVLLAAFDTVFFSRLPEAAELWGELQEALSPLLRPDFATAETLRALWRSALLEENRPRPGSAARRSALALELLVSLVRAARVNRAESTAERVAGVAREVATSFFEVWTLDRAAARAGCTRRRFSALYREHTGASFLDRLTVLRLDHAAELLRGGAHTVAGVAFASGFNDLSHFYRLFRKRFGQAPAKWAEQHAGSMPGRARALLNRMGR